jgi:hypothetical protein
MDHNPKTLIDACKCGDTQTLVNVLLKNPSDIHITFELGRTLVHTAVLHFQPKVLELLCAGGANLTLRDLIGDSPMHYNIFSTGPKTDACFRILVANGVRLRDIERDSVKNFTPWQRKFERGVLRCRTAVVAILRVKKAGNLWRWDKFLLKEIGYAIWATRYSNIWSE